MIYKPTEFNYLIGKEFKDDDLMLQPYKEPTCPICGSTEMHPDKDKLLIRVDKVHDGISWLSECLVCAGYYDILLNETPQNYEPKDSTWFRT